MDVKVSDIPEAAAVYQDGETEAPAVQKPYRLRRLNASDLFLMVKILSKIEISELISCLNSPKVADLIKSFFEKSEDGDQEDEIQTTGKNIDDMQFLAGMGVAIEIVNKIFKYLPSCQNEIFQLLSNVSGKDIKEIEQLDAEVFANMLVDFMMKEELKAFIQAALRLMK